uniref:Uncharacterized protein n=1 Tax=Anguilla anguilla TaxID=7936 RepID=A0A0E9W0A3_ANGAN
MTSDFITTGLKKTHKTIFVPRWCTVILKIGLLLFIIVHSKIFSVNSTLTEHLCMSPVRTLCTL